MWTHFIQKTRQQNISYTDVHSLYIEEERQKVWPMSTPLQTKLCGSWHELENRTSFITGRVAGERRRKRKASIHTLHKIPTEQQTQEEKVYTSLRHFL
ncbi:hypothetical protein ACOMHN_021535 [Nucella lapillus]